jgi:8-oxo-dGTP pyrophosphatase MutT (NUDIX family)
MSGVKDAAERWPVVSSAELFRGRLVAVRTDKVRTPDNHLAEREVVLHPGAVAVLPLDAADRVLVIRQYRHPVERLLWEIPAGLRDVAGEDPWTTARRELLEEAGYRARDWRVLADYYSSPGFSTERLRVYLARDLERVPEAERDFVPEAEEAELLTAWLPLEEAVGKILRGELHNGVAALGILAGYAARSEGFDRLRPADAPEGLSFPRADPKSKGALESGRTTMKVGVPREVKNHEYRVAITPAGVHELARGGHQVVIQAGAGGGSAIPDEDFVAAGAKILSTADDVWAEGELIL